MAFSILGNSFDTSTYRQVYRLNSGFFILTYSLDSKKYFQSKIDTEKYRYFKINILTFQDRYFDILIEKISTTLE